jgi:type IV pilus assembly protein PilN
MIRINLLPREERVASPKLTLPKFGGTLLPIGILGGVVVLVGLFAGLERAKVAALRKDVVQLRDEVRAIQPQVDRVKKLTAQREDLERRLDIIRQLDEGRFVSVRMMDNMSREVPKYLWLTSVRQDGPTSVTIKGITFSNLIVADFMMGLERSPIFANVDLVQTNRGKINDRDVMEFAITARLTPDEVPSDFSAEAMIEDLLSEGNGVYEHP